MAHLAQVRLTILLGGAAMRWHLGRNAGLGETVAGWRHRAPTVFALPHPSWRTHAWRRSRPWFEEELLPALRAQVAEVLHGP